MRFSRLLLPFLTFALVFSSGCHRHHADEKKSVKAAIVQTPTENNRALVPNADLKGINLANRVLDNINLNGANLSEANLQGASLKGANLSDIQYESANFNNAVYDQKTQFPTGFDPQAHGMRFEPIVGPQADFQGMDLSTAKVDFSNKDLSGANFEGANLSGVAFKDSTLSNVNFTNAKLSKASFKNCDLSNTQFTNAILKHAQFKQVNFENTHFTETDLSHADLTDANLNGAQFTRTKMVGANLRGADLSQLSSGTIDLTDAVYDQTTKFPPQFDPGALLMKPAQAAKQYYVFLGPFIDAQTAQAAIDDLMRNGMRRQPRMIEVNGHYLLEFAVYPDYREAQAMANDFRKHNVNLQITNQYQ